MTPLDFLIGAVGIAAAGFIFYLLYLFEKQGTWDDLVKGNNKRLLLGTVSSFSILAAIIAGIAGGTAQQNSLLPILTPVAMGLGVYFLSVSLLYKPQ